MKKYALYTWRGRWNGQWEPFYTTSDWGELLAAVRRYREEFPDWKMQAWRTNCPSAGRDQQRLPVR